MEEETENKKIAILTGAGYSEKEISELREDKVAFKERVSVIQRGHTRREIEKIGAEKLMKRAIREMAKTSWDAQKRSRSD